MSYAEAFAPAEAHYRAIQMAATWGHLAAAPCVQHKARVVFTEGAYGSITIISSRIDGVSDSPWLFEHLRELAARKCRHGRVSVFEGTYRMLKNGRGVWIGKTRVVRGL